MFARLQVGVFTYPCRDLGRLDRIAEHGVSAHLLGKFSIE